MASDIPCAYSNKQTESMRLSDTNVCKTEKLLREFNTQTKSHCDMEIEIKCPESL